MYELSDIQPQQGKLILQVNEERVIEDAMFQVNLDK